MFTRRPLVSVILPSFNHVQFVAEAVKSVLHQTLTQLELIVVDDGSTDGTAEVVAAMRDSRLRCIALKENRRLNPRNVGLAVARGRYVAFQNSDDTWEPTKLEKQVRYLEQQPEVSVCFTGVQIIDEQHQPLSDTWANGVFQTTNKSSVAWLRYFFDYGNALCISSACIRRNVLKKVGWFRPSLIQLSDLDLWIRLAAVGELRILSESLTNMRIVQGRNVSTPSPAAGHRYTQELLEVLDRFTQPLVLPHLSSVFADVIPQPAQTEVAQLAALAQHAWTLRASQVLFGNNLMAKLLDNPQHREELCETFGIDLVHQFIHKRGEVDVVLDSGV